MNFTAVLISCCLILPICQGEGDTCNQQIAQIIHKMEEQERKMENQAAEISALKKDQEEQVWID